jgi:hypothetical protein
MNNLPRILAIASALLGVACATPATVTPVLRPPEPAASGCPKGTELMQGQCVRRLVSRGGSCPAGWSRVGTRCERGIPADIAQTQPDAPPPDPEAAIPDSRPLRTRPRAAALLISEIKSLESLLSSTRHNTPDRPRLVRRIAEDYAELGARLSTDLTNAPPNRDKLAKLMDASRNMAIKHYQSLLDRHPSYEKLDEVHYYLAVELQLAGDSDGWRAALSALLERYPESSLAEQAQEALEH